ncbi:GNAT family N-acetyltransferase [Micromonospora sp. AKA38]|uniref:GNAT family N-acetyltransferase n=1 Tax=Micromonospora sp. AKA38 TaxID=2733861 RepID=UPI00249071CD|nr:GNAT family protein [Micromonospora sp. AKA38]
MAERTSAWRAEAARRVALMADELVVRPISAEQAQAVTEWHYDGKYGIYDTDGSDGLMAAEDGFFAVMTSEGRLIANGCTGDGARVPGLAEDPEVCDWGLGMDPEWVGHGQGAGLAHAALSYIREKIRGSRVRGIRGVVLSWNKRSIAFAEGIGFEKVGVHYCEQGGNRNEYVVLYQSLDKLDEFLSAGRPAVAVDQRAEVENPQLEVD